MLYRCSRGGGELGGPERTKPETRERDHLFPLFDLSPNLVYAGYGDLTFFERCASTAHC